MYSHRAPKPVVPFFRIDSVTKALTVGHLGLIIPQIININPVERKHAPSIKKNMEKVFIRIVSILNYNV